MDDRRHVGQVYRAVEHIKKGLDFDLDNLTPEVMAQLEKENKEWQERAKLLLANRSDSGKLDTRLQRPPGHIKKDAL